MARMKHIQIELTNKQIELLDRLVKRKTFFSRNEAVAEAIRKLVRMHRKYKHIP